jgi:hypothetical protein
MSAQDFHRATKRGAVDARSGAALIVGGLLLLTRP